MTSAGAGNRPRSFVEQLHGRWRRGLFVCIGLDPVYSRIPEHLRTGRSRRRAIVTFIKDIMDATGEVACAFKPNSAFYEAEGKAGVAALQELTSYARSVHPDVPVILDAKRGDIDSTNAEYAVAAFDWIGADAITVHPYLGQSAMKPFLDRSDKGVFVLVKTSNEGSGEFQDLAMGDSGLPLYRVVAQKVCKDWNGNNNCGVVVGATYPDALRQVRSDVGDLPILVPGVATQGGRAEQVVRAGLNSANVGLIVNASRAVIYASPDHDYARAARSVATALTAELNSYV